MKSCPTCNRTYPDDNLAFCLMDGSVLSAPYDPAARPTRDVNPPPTEVMSRAPGTVDTGQDQLRPTAPSLPLTTIQAPPPALPAQERAQPPSPKRTNRNLVLALVVGSVLVIAVVVSVIVNRPSNRSAAPSNPASNSDANSTSGAATLAEAMAKKEASIREQLRADPDNPRLNAQLAQSLFIQGENSESETLARKAIRLDPNISAPHYTLAFILKEQNKLAESEAEKKKADELHSKGQ